jgi:cyclopropane fatty-acyl-phospholipid synthase-like methyltransferase
VSRKKNHFSHSEYSLPATDQAGKEYWDKLWSKRDLPQPLDPANQNLANHIGLQLHLYFSKYIKDYTPEHGELIEVGCAGSPWLPYFAREFGLGVHGLDYSELGCKQAEYLLEKHSVNGFVHHCNLFSLPPALMKSFDIVFSFGLVEHFRPTEAVIKQLASLAKKTGLILTVVPNLQYLPGVLMKVLNRAVYDVHVPLSSGDLKNAHGQCGLEVLDCRHLGLINLSALNLSGKEGKCWCGPTLHLFSWISKAVWIMERLGLRTHPNSVTSPYIVCVARR